MNQKSLSAKNKTHKKILSYLKNKKILKIFKEFKNSLNINDKFAVAVSGGPDSLALAFLAKCFSLKYNVVIKYFIVDHKLRKESSSEAKNVISILKKIGIDCKILTWNGKKPNTNIQSVARDKRYSLLVKECKKNKIKYLLLGHHQDDLFENFLIRILRGSGLNGLISLSKKTRYKDKNIKILRPLLDLQKKDLTYLSKTIFNFFVNDPSNEDNKYQRIKIRNIISEFKKNGLDKDKLFLTLKNLKKSNQAIIFYIEQNKKLNSFLFKNKRELVLNKNFFNHPYEVVFRSFSDSLKIIGDKYNFTRGKKIDLILDKIKKNTLKKETLAGCVIKKVNQTVIITKEH